MDKLTTYPGAIPLETDVANAQRFAEAAIGYLAESLIGAGPWISNLAVAPSTVPSMVVQVARGAIFSPQVIDASAFGSLPAVALPLLKIGINEATTLLTFVAPGTAGQSQAFLIQANFAETDAVPVVLPFYNSANPALAFNGPGNSGTPSYTQRIQRATIQVVSGTPAATGSQTTPAVTAGWVPLAVVTVANGTTAITSGMIAVHPACPNLDAGATGLGITSGRLISVKGFNPGDTLYTATPGTKTIVVEAQAGGGAGGGCYAALTSYFAAGGGGCGGAYAKVRMALPSATVALSVGSGGAVALGANDGGAGGATTFGSTLVIVPGGPGGGQGVGTTSANYTLSGAGPTPSGAVSISAGLTLHSQLGQEGQDGFSVGGGSIAKSGAGGNSFLGQGAGDSGTNQDGHSPSGFGAGSSGATSANGGGAHNSIAGGAGRLLVWEYS